MEYIDKCCEKTSDIISENILIFGGSGSLGKKTIERWINSNTIVNVSRDEEKQWQLKTNINNVGATPPQFCICLVKNAVNSYSGIW